jgi:hypothetical protein
MEGVMEKRKKLRWVLFISMAVLLMPYVHPVYGTDELSQSGFVKSVDVVKKIVTIDVKSSTCRGIRQFLVEKPAAFENLVGERIYFLIDSSTCKQDEIYTVNSYWRDKR